MVARHRYVLENADEFERLERQSGSPEYDCSRELSSFAFQSGSHILDAGCGSGIVSRFLAETYPDCTITGCDFSEERMAQARKAASLIPNLKFEVRDLAQDELGEYRFDHVISRYVFHHLPKVQHEFVLRKLSSALKPGGQLILIDLDGFLYNIYPQTEQIRDALLAIERKSPVDLKIGRKLFSLFTRIGLTEISTEIQTLNFTGASLEREIGMMKERLEQSSEALSNVLGSDEASRQFQRSYLSLLMEPGTTLFYNKFVVSGKKADLRSRVRSFRTQG